MSDSEHEKEIQAKGLTAPRVTPAQLERTILAEQFHVFPGTTVTVCCLTLQNGFNVVGESAAASPANFDGELGKKIAREHAKQKIWALEGYLLRQRLHEGPSKQERIEREIQNAPRNTEDPDKLEHRPIG